MDISRRKFIKVMGTGALIFGSNPVMVSCNKMPPKAILPWQPKKHKDDRITMLSYAILAPNPHNRQPWKVDLSQPDSIILYCDSNRLLPETDPFSRQIMIGHGTFLELLDIAASHLGFQLKIRYFPEGEFDPKTVKDRPIAKIALKKNPQRTTDPLFLNLLQRRSTKEPFETTPLKLTHQKELQIELNQSPFMSKILTDKDLVRLLREITLKAWKIESYTPRTMKESVDLMRIGSSEVEANPNGIDLLGTSIWWGKFFGIIDRKTLMDPMSSAFQTGVDIYTEMLLNTPAFFWLASKNNSRATQLQIGRTYARLDLKATQLGVRIHPVSQVLQEYSEMQDLQMEFLKMLNIPNTHTVQMLARLGYAKQPGPSPRQTVDTFIQS